MCAGSVQVTEVTEVAGRGHLGEGAQARPRGGEAAGGARGRLETKSAGRGRTRRAIGHGVCEGGRGEKGHANPLRLPERHHGAVVTVEDIRDALVGDGGRHVSLGGEGKGGSGVSAKSTNACSEEPHVHTVCLLYHRSSAWGTRVDLATRTSVHAARTEFERPRRVWCVMYLGARRVAGIVGVEARVDGEVPGVACLRMPHLHRALPVFVALNHLDAALAGLLILVDRRPQPHRDLDVVHQDTRVALGLLDVFHHGGSGWGGVVS